MIDGKTWEILAVRLEEIRQAREALECDEVVELVFDADDQAALRVAS